jgi:magnesium-transporting ATPase (P-type)
MFGGFNFLFGEEFSLDLLNPSSNNGFGLFGWIFFLIALSSTIYTFTNQESKKAKYDGDVDITDKKNKILLKVGILSPVLISIVCILIFHFINENYFQSIKNAYNSFLFLWLAVSAILFAITSQMSHLFKHLRPIKKGSLISLGIVFVLLIPVLYTLLVK